MRGSPIFENLHIADVIHIVSCMNDLPCGPVSVRANVGKYNLLDKRTLPELSRYDTITSQSFGEYFCQEIH